MPESRRRFAAIVMPVLVGIIALTTVLSRPRVAQYRTVDMLSLVAAGMCFGVALAGLARLWRGRT